MYHHLRGEIIELSPTSVVVDVAGVGYDLRIPVSTYDRLKGKKEARLLTHLLVREDEHRLYGFATPGERELFRLFLSVTGVGPSIAVTSLSFLEPADLARAVAQGDLKTLQKVKGVGRKLAERLVIELRDRVGALLVALGAAPAPPPRRGDLPPPSSRSIPEVADTISALIALGYDRKSAEERADTAFRKLTAGNSGRDGETGQGREEAGREGPSVERLIKECLRPS